MSEDRRVAERRTLALRGPGAGGFTPAQSLAASNPCLNCGTNIQLAYCPECGQREIDADPTLREFLRELAEEMLHWDGKLLTTFRLLLTKPGQLTQEYLAGRRVRYISPLRVYLVCSVLYFALSATLPKEQSRAREGRVGIAQAGLVTVSIPENSKLQGNLDAAKPGQGNAAARALQRAARSETLSASIPKLMFLLLPMFAALIALGFRDRRRRFPQHLAFALHVHAVLFLGLTVMLVGRVSPMLRTSSSAIVGGLLGMYLLIAARRVYGGNQVGIIFRLIGVFGVYFIAFAATMVAAYAAINLFA
jgi:hypothetical protein